MVQFVPGVLHFTVLCWIFGNRAVLGENGISLVTESEVVTVTNGSKLILNCTILGHINATQIAAKKLFWSYGDQQLTSNTRAINNRTKQLIFNSISWHSAGEYWCRLSTFSYHIPAVKVSVIVGDIPGKPIIIKWENVELEFKLYWLAPIYDGGLPLEYCFKYAYLLDQKNECHPSSYYSVQDGVYSSYFKLYNRFMEHTIWIEARNTLGSVESPPMVASLPYEVESVHPCQVNVTSLRGESRKIEVYWRRDQRPECSWSNGRKYHFNISYRAQGDLHSESNNISRFPNKMFSLDNLKPYTLYYVFISFHLEDGGFSTLPSSVIGPRTARTKEEAPSEGPTNIHCKAVVWPLDKRKMNVTLVWKPPPRNKWNGIIRSYQVQYRKQEAANRTVNLTIRSASSRQLVLSGLNASVFYHFLLRACTTDQDHCSSAQQCTAKNLSQDLRTEVVSQTNNWLLTFIPAAASVFALAAFLAIVVAVYLWRKKKLISSSPSSSSSPQPGELRDLLATWPSIAPSEFPLSEGTLEAHAVYCEIKDSDESSTDSVLISLGRGTSESNLV